MSIDWILEFTVRTLRSNSMGGLPTPRPETNDAKIKIPSEDKANLTEEQKKFLAQYADKDE